MTIRAKDKAALKRCIEIASLDPDRAAQLQSMLNDEPWEQVAVFACGIVQSAALSLHPWEAPPVYAEIIDAQHGVQRDPDAYELLEQMLRAGMSKFEPDPPAALRAIMIAEMKVQG